MDASNLELSDWLWKEYRIIAFYHSLRDPGYRPLPQMIELPQPTTHHNQPDHPTLDYATLDYATTEFVFRQPKDFDAPY